MKILVLKAGRQPYDTDFIDYFNKYGQETGNTYIIGYLDDVIFDFRDPITITIDGVNILDYDFIYFRTWEKRPDIASTLAKHLIKHSKKFADSAVGLSNYGSKIHQHYLLITNGLNLPATFIIHKRLLDENLESHIQKLGGYPAVLKATRGNEGKGVYLLNSFDDYVKIKEELKDEYYFIQELIPNDFDYRFVVFGEKVAVVKKRVRNKDSAEFRNNVSLGAEVEYLKPEDFPEISEIAVKAAKVKNLQVAGVDVVASNKNSKIYLFEVNPAPAFRHDFTVLKYLDEYFKSIS